MEGTSQYIVMSSTAVEGVYASTYANPSEWMFEAFGGRKSEAGIAVNADKALQYAPWFQGISIIAGDVARVPLDAFERKNDDDRKKRRDHMAWWVLNRKANRYMTAFTVREILLAHALSWGNGYAAIGRSGSAGATVESLVPLMPDVTEPKKTDDGRVVYETRLDDGTTRYYSPDDVLHIRGLGSGLMGYSVFSYARNSLGLGLAAERHGSRFFSNDAKPGVVLKTPQRLEKPDADLLLDMWEQRHASNPNRPALAAGGLDVMTLPISNEDAQFIEVRKFQRDEVASWLLLPPHKLGSDSRLSYNSVEAEERSYVSQTLMRWFKRFESECDDKLLTERQKRAFWYFEHNTGALIQGDFTTQANVAVQLKNAMIITKNEARKKFNLNSVEGGDEFENANTATNATATPEPEPAPKEDIDTAAHRELISDRVLQLVKSEKTSLKRIVKSNDPIFAIKNYYDMKRDKIRAAIEPVLRVYKTVSKCAATAEDIATQYCSMARQDLIEVIQSTPEHCMTQAVEDLLEMWANTWPHRVLEWITESKND